MVPSPAGLLRAQEECLEVLEEYLERELPELGLRESGDGGQASRAAATGDARPVGRRSGSASPDLDEWLWIPSRWWSAPRFWAPSPPQVIVVSSTATDATRRRDGSSTTEHTQTQTTRSVRHGNGSTTTTTTTTTAVREPDDERRRREEEEARERRRRELRRSLLLLVIGGPAVMVVARWATRSDTLLDRVDDRMQDATRELLESEWQPPTTARFLLLASDWRAYAHSERSFLRTRAWTVSGALAGAVLATIGLIFERSFATFVGAAAAGGSLSVLAWKVADRMLGAKERHTALQRMRRESRALRAPPPYAPSDEVPPAYPAFTYEEL